MKIQRRRVREAAAAPEHAVDPGRPPRDRAAASTGRPGPTTACTPAAHAPVLPGHTTVEGRAARRRPPGVGQVEVPNVADPGVDPRHLGRVRRDPLDAHRIRSRCSTWYPKRCQPQRVPSRPSPISATMAGVAGRRRSTPSWWSGVNSRSPRPSLSRSRSMPRSQHAPNRAASSASKRRRPAAHPRFLRPPN